MSREEKLEKILKMTKEIFVLYKDNISESEIDKLYIETKVLLESLKELYKE